MSIDRTFTKYWLFIIWLVFIVFQMTKFWDNIIPNFNKDFIVTKGLVCTCPDATVIKGKDYLISNTPDSLKKFNIDYSEIWFTETPQTSWDYQAKGKYIVYGQVIGKNQVSKSDTWNPLFEVKSFKEYDPFFDNVLRIIIISQILILILLIRRKIKH